MLSRFLFVALFVMLAGPSCAETLYLKDGQTIKGKIIEQTDSYTRIEVDGITRKFTSFEIERMEKDQDAQAPIDTQGILETQAIPLSKLDAIKTLVEINGTKQAIKQSIDQVMTNAPEEKKAELENLFKLEEIMASLYPVYDKYYTENDLKELIKFYQSAAGQKMVEVSPNLLRETMEASIKYFQSKIK